jgi:hypothetical protein
MSNSFKKSRYGWLALFIILTLFGAACKSKQKAMAVTDNSAEKAKLEQEASMRKQKEDEAQRKRDEEEKARRDEAEARERANAPQAKLEQYFSAIANAGSLSSANSSINEALTLFASEDAPVLIVISESAGKKDYDKPTTIKAYLNYLKDQRKNINRISNLHVDGAGKITEVELVK